MQVFPENKAICIPAYIRYVDQLLLHPKEELRVMVKRQGKLQRSKNLPLGFPGRAGGASHQQPPRRDNASSSEHAGSFLHVFISS